MSRLTELEERSIVGMLSRIKAQHTDMKTTPQPTSVKSGVRTYQVPENNLNSEVEFVRSGSTSMTRNLIVPGTGSINNLKSLEVETTFTPQNQKSPVVYPYLLASIDDAYWEPLWHPSLGLIFSLKNNQSFTLQSSEYMIDETDYGATDKIVYRHRTTIFYATSGTSPATIKLRYQLRSTDRGTTKVKARLYG